MLDITAGFFCARTYTAIAAVTEFICTLCGVTLVDVATVTAVFFINIINATSTSMDNQNHQGRIRAAKVREALSELAETICSGADSLRISFSGNSFTFHLEGATVNITMSEAAARPQLSEEKGGAL